MSNPLPNLLDRNFIVGYFLPALVLVMANLALIYFYPLSVEGQHLLAQVNILLGTATLVLVSALVGVFLLALNRAIIRLMEGYGNRNPAHILDWCQRQLNRSQAQRFAKMSLRIYCLRKKRARLAGTQEKLPEAHRQELNELTRLRAEQFPTRGDSLLPTAFGNAIRAFETYPYKMYGIEGTRGWTRLLAVIPKDYRELIDDGKAQMDFWVNLWAVSVLYVLTYCLYGVLVGPWELLWTTIPALVLAFLASSAAKRAAIGWGSSVKASFDIFLPDLRAKLELPFPTDTRNEREQWNRFSKAFLYADDEAVHNRSRGGSADP